MAQTGACCLGDGNCVNTDDSGCGVLAGDFVPERNCAQVDCKGACCLPTKACFEATRDSCGVAGGSFQGPETTCSVHCPGATTTAFTYQGQLKENGSPLSEPVDLRIRLFDQAVEGSEAAPGLQRDGVQVMNGLFSVDLDFGGEAFSGNARWLEIAVRVPSDPTNTQSFTTLSPRQALTAVPYALALPGMRTTPSPTSPSVIGGSKVNTTSGLNGATIAGGGAPEAANTVTDLFGTIGGGASNTAGNDNTFINDKSFATVSGGELNMAGGAYSAVPGGQSNVASGDFSFAAGRRAKAVTTGSFVWADSKDADFTSTVPDQFLIRAGGGVGIGEGPFTTDADLQIGTDPVLNTVFGGTNLQIGGTSSAQLVIGRPNGDYFQLATSSLSNQFNVIGSGGLQLRTGQTAGSSVVRMFVSSEGDVGIGTAAPSARLDVEGSLEVDSTTLVANSTTHRVGIGTATPGTTLDVAGSLTIDAGSLFVNAATNRVGIGTTSPTATLDVVGSMSVDSGVVCRCDQQPCGS